MRKSKLFLMSALLASAAFSAGAQEQTVHTCDVSSIQFEDCEMPAIQADAATEKATMKNEKEQTTQTSAQTKSDQK
jgi:hypothetical protein